MTFAEFLPSWNAGMNAVSASALIASVGQRFTHAVQPIHVSMIR